MGPIARLADARLRQLMRSLPTALLLVGPRGTGKTTTLTGLADEVLSLDAPDVAAAVASNPDAALVDRREPLLIDEWQAVPQVLGAVKRSLDAPGGARPGRFLLSGSVSEELADTGGSWAGTGRLVRLALFGLTVREQLGLASAPGFIDRIIAGADLGAASDPPDLGGYVDLALMSGFPVPALQIPDEGTRRIWLQGYASQLITLDLEQLAGHTTREPVRMRELLRAYAANSAGIVSDASLRDAAGISRPTLRRWQRLLEALFVIDLVPAWRAGRTARLAAAPKRYVVDPGLWAAIAGTDRTAILDSADLLGRAIDTFVAAQLRAECDWSDHEHRLHHVRSEEGREIDLVAELTDGRLVAIEIKASSAPRSDDAKHLRWFREKIAGDRVAASILLHTGPRTFQLTDDVTAVSISALWRGDTAS